MGIEFELKFKATPRQQNLLLELMENWQTIQMETTYYDTTALSLSSIRYTLRRRLENGVSVCTVKTPAENNSRGEWEVEAPSIDAAIPMLCKLGCPQDLASLTAGGVIPICGARFRRRAAQLTHGNSLLEIALDDGELFSKSRSIPLCEVEVELKSGDTADAVAFAGSLAKLFDLQPEPVSKFRRALALFKEEKSHGTA